MTSRREETGGWSSVARKTVPSAHDGRRGESFLMVRCRNGIPKRARDGMQSEVYSSVLTSTVSPMRRKSKKGAQAATRGG
jgi:hypothetical protein